MMRWILLAVLIVGVTAAATVVVQSLPEESAPGRPRYPVAEAQGPQPKAVVDGDLTYHFGSKAQQVTFDKAWVIRNEGDADLQLRLEAPPCSCTVAGFQTENGVPTGTAKVIPPKGETKIHFTWQTRENNGKYLKSATILTNDPERPRLEFTAEGEVSPAVMVFPQSVVDFQEISTDEKEHATSILVFSRDKPDFKITKLATSKPQFFDVEQEPMSTAELADLKIEAGHKVTVKAKPGLPLAPFVEELRMETDHPKQPELKLTMTGKVVGPIAVLPERVRLFGIPGQKGGSKEVTLLVRGHRPTRFEVTRSPERFKVDVQPSDNSSKSGKYRLTVTVPAGTPPGTVDDVIILKTDHPQAGELRIPVYGFISDNDAG